MNIFTRVVPIATLSSLVSRFCHLPLIPCLILFNLVVSTSLIPGQASVIRFVDTTPLVVLCYGACKGATKGATFGFFVGLGLDLMLANLFGLYTTLCFLLGYWSGRMLGGEIRLRFVFVALAACMLLALYQFAAIVGFSAYFGDFSLFRKIRTVALPRAAITAAAFTLHYALYLCCCRVFRKGVRKHEARKY